MVTKVASGTLGMATPFGELLGKSTAELNAELQDYQNLGVKYVRMDLHWDTIEKTKGTYDWTLWDRVVDAATSRGIEVVGVLNNAPSWVSGTLSNSASQQALGAFAGDAAAHFGDRIDAWEVLNEPNMKGISASNYAAALEHVYDEIKAVDAGDTVVTAGLAAIPRSENGMTGAADFLEGIYNAGAGDSFDAVGYHAYTYPHFPENPAEWSGWQIMEDDIRGLMVANGDADKQIWVTEVGAPTQGGSQSMSEAEQAEVLEQSVELARDSGYVGPVLWYSYKDRGGSTGDMENWFGMVDANGNPKDAYYTFKELAAQSPNSTPAAAPAAPPAAIDMDTDTIVINAAHTEIDDYNGQKIDLAALDAIPANKGNQSFNFIGTDWLADKADLGFYQDTAHDKTYVQGDTDGDGAYDVNVVIAGVHSFTADDFIL